MDVNSISVVELSNRVKELYCLSDDIEISLLKYSENINYRIYEKKKEKKYALRLCRPNYHTYEELQSEVTWISKIEKNTDVSVATPIKGIDGGYVQQLTLGAGVFYCCMFAFLEGVTLREITDEDKSAYYMRTIGSITAKLHNQVIEWEDSDSLNRFTWDYEDFFGENSRWGDWHNDTHLQESDYAYIEQALGIIKKNLSSYGKGKDRYGLIHTDLNNNNVIINGNDCYVIDFDDCGYGWFLYDASTALLECDDNLEDMIRAWLEGYESIRKLSEEDYKMIMTFIVMKRIIRFQWVGSHMDNDTVKKIPQSNYECSLKLIRRYLETQNYEDFF